MKNCNEYHHTLFFTFHVDVDECTQVPCQNNGSCVNNNGSYACACEAGWTGQHCENGK